MNNHWSAFIIHYFFISATVFDSHFLLQFCKNYIIKSSSNGNSALWYLVELHCIAWIKSATKISPHTDFSNNNNSLNTIFFRISPQSLNLSSTFPSFCKLFNSPIKTSYTDASKHVLCLLSPGVSLLQDPSFPSKLSFTPRNLSSNPKDIFELSAAVAPFKLSLEMFYHLIILSPQFFWITMATQPATMMLHIMSARCSDNLMWHHCYPSLHSSTEASMTITNQLK